MSGRGCTCWATEGDLQRFSRRKREPPAHLLPVNVGPYVRAVGINGLASAAQYRGGCRSDGDEPASRKQQGRDGRSPACESSSRATVDDVPPRADVMSKENNPKVGNFTYIRAE